MAKITEKETGRPDTRYKKKYLDLQKKYNSLMENRLGIAEKSVESNDNDEKAKVTLLTSEPKKGVVEASKQAETPSLNQSKVLNAKGENLTETSEKPLKDLEIIEAETETAPAKEKINLDDYDFRCSECLELFNKNGNEVEEGIKCPDCGKVYSNG